MTSKISLVYTDQQPPSDTSYDPHQPAFYARVTKYGDVMELLSGIQITEKENRRVENE